MLYGGSLQEVAFQMTRLQNRQPAVPGRYLTFSLIELSLHCRKSLYERSNAIALDSKQHLLSRFSRLKFGKAPSGPEVL